jgi:hypothetical protein
MSLVYITLCLGAAVGVGWLVVVIDERARRLPAEIDDVLDEQPQPTRDRTGDAR